MLPKSEAFVGADDRGLYGSPIALALPLVAWRTVCQYFVGYGGRAMGAMMEAHRGGTVASRSRMSISSPESSLTGQRLSIARVLLDLAAFIFDYAAASVESECERAFQHPLEELARNRTPLVNAHRLSTVCSAGQILVPTEDGVEEDGTHSEPLVKSGTYPRLMTCGFTFRR